jgi:hypothetical protein
VGWQRDWEIKYRAFDLIQWQPEITQLDITRDRLPECDAILSRMVLNHLDDERILMALALFRQAARYLIATQFHCGGPRRSVQFTRLDLIQPPFNLGKPLEEVADGVEENCRLALWRL